jgi:hypothetical protein
MDCFASLAMTEEKRPGSLPALRFFVDGRVKPGHDDVEMPQFSEARFGGVAGHDLIRAS